MESTNNDLVGLFVRIGELLHRQRHYAHQTRGPAADPHRGQGRVLALLKMRPEISQKDLSYLLDIRPQSLGELLAKLERNGYIQRDTSEDDRRAMNIRLTEAGAAATERTGAQSDMFSSLDGEEQGILKEYLERIIAELEESLASMRDDPDFAEGCRHGHGPHGPHDHPHEMGRHGGGGPFGRHGRGSEGGVGPHGHGRGHGRCGRQRPDFEDS